MKGSKRKGRIMFRYPEIARNDTKVQGLCYWRKYSTLLRPDEISRLGREQPGLASISLDTSQEERTLCTWVEGC